MTQDEKKAAIPWGQKDAIALRYVTEAGPAGIAALDLHALLGSTQKAVCAAMTRLRKQGHGIIARREEGNRCRFFLAEHDPGKWVPPAKRERKPPKKPQDVAGKVWGLVSRAEGASRDELARGFHPDRRAIARQELNRLLAEGKATQYKKPRPEGGKPMIRLFAGPPAPGWVSMVASAAGAPRVKEQPKWTAAKAAAPLPRSAKPWQPPQPKELPPPIIPPTVKVQVLPSVQFDQRYQVDPSMRVVGGFAAMGRGRYLEGRAA